MKNKILAIIPCRSGSKKLKNKNILKIENKHLIYYSIYFAKKCKFIDRIVVSTDSNKYGQIAKSYGAEVPFLRPKKISKDKSLDVDFLKHCAIWLEKKYKYKPDLIIHLRPTSPLRKVSTLSKAINIMLKNKKIDSLRSISPSKENIFKVWYKKRKNYLTPVIKNQTKFKEPFNAPRQCLENTFVQNATYDVFRPRLLKKNLISGKNIFGLITKENIDIDDINDLKHLIKSKQLKNFKSYIMSK